MKFSFLRLQLQLQRCITPTVCASLLAVTAVSFVGSDVKHARSLEHKAACACQSDDAVQSSSLRYPKNRRVLIVGGGLTGCLVAYFLQQNNGNSNIDDDDDGDDDGDDGALSIDMWERSSYHSGRFGAIAQHSGATADLGSQVLSTVDPSDPRVCGEGNGATMESVHKAWDIVSKLRRNGLLRTAPNDLLCPTEQRMLWEGLWIHHWAPQGLTSVLRYLCRTSADSSPVAFSRRLLSISSEGGDKPLFVVRGLQRSNDGEDFMVEGTYDAVIVCTPAPDVLSVAGIADLLDGESTRILRSVRYNSRVATALFFHPSLRNKLEDIFIRIRQRQQLDEGDSITTTGCGEINIEAEDNDTNNAIDNCSHQMKLHLVALQDLKKANEQSPDNKPLLEQGKLPCTIVVHSQEYRNHDAATLAQEQPDTSNKSLAQQLCSLLAAVPNSTLSKDELLSNLLYEKTIDWTVGQSTTPMEAVVCDPPRDPPLYHLEAVQKEPLLIVAGDFMTQSSFLGCVSTADSAARAVRRNLMLR